MLDFAHNEEAPSFMKEPPLILRFGSFEADLSAGELRRNGRKLKLQEQPFQILVALLERSGEVVTREDLRQRLWAADTFVDFDNGLNIAIRKLRQALGDDAEKPRYIETLPRRGYRFITAAESILPSPLPAAGGALPVEPYPGGAPTLSRDGRVVPISHGLDLSPRLLSSRDLALAVEARDPAPSTADAVTSSASEVGPSVIPRTSGREGLSLPVAASLAGAAILVVVLVVATVEYLRSGTHRSSRDAGSGRGAAAGPASLGSRPSVATLGIKNLSPDAKEEWLSTALSEMLASELNAGERVLTIPGEDVARARIDLALPEADSYSPETLQRIRRRLAVDYVVVGSCFTSGQSPSAPVRLDVRLQDARSGRTVTTLTEAGMQGDLPGLVTRTGAHLRQNLGLEKASAEQAEGVRADLPSNNDGARLYAGGLAKLRDFDAQGARDLLEQAVAADPAFAPAHAALAQAWSRLGYAELAKQEAKKAYDLSAKLPRADRLSIEAGYRETNAEWDQAVKIYQTLFSFFPDNADYGLRLATAEVQAGKGRDALATIAQLRALEGPLRDDPAVDLVESTAADQLGDVKGAEAAAEAAAAHAQSRGAGILAADALARQCRELPLLGKFDDARTACIHARELYVRAGDRDGVAAATGYLAAVLDNQSQPDAARQMYEEALAVDETIGNKGGAIWQINGLANVAWAQGDLAGARARYEQAMSVARATGSRADAAEALNSIAFTHLLQGNLGQARSTFEAALASYRSIANQVGVADALGNLGATLYFQGDLSGAARTLEEALAADRDTGNRPQSADALAWSGRVRIAQGNLEDAGDRYRQAMAVWREMGNKGYEAQCGLGLAEISVESGQPAAAEQPIREGIDWLRREKRFDQEIEAHALLALALLRQGKVREAQHEIDETSPAVNHTQSYSTRLQLSIAAARVRAASGKDSEITNALKSLEAALATAKRERFLGYELEIRLAMGEIEMKGQRSGGAARLAILQKDAESKGFGLIARKAAAAREIAPVLTPKVGKSVRSAVWRCVFPAGDSGNKEGS